MAIQFIGHTSNYAVWAFNINGKKFVGRNFSTETPRLALRWVGGIDDNEYNRIKSTVGWVKPEDYGSSGFAITNSTATTADWVWRGVPYRSFYTVIEGEDEVGDLFYELTFGAPTNLAQQAADAAEAARLKQAESDRSAAEARAKQAEADRAAAEARARQDRAAAEEARLKQAEADRVAAETRRKQEEANKAAEAAKNAKSQIAPPTGINWVTLGLQLGAAYLLLS
jgi:flagellar biosynthesis GTPase FlhF